MDPMEYGVRYCELQASKDAVSLLGATEAHGEGSEGSQSQEQSLAPKVSVRGNAPSFRGLGLCRSQLNLSAAVFTGSLDL